MLEYFLNYDTLIYITVELHHTQVLASNVSA